jgi:hypothetical protein
MKKPLQISFPLPADPGEPRTEQHIRDFLKAGRAEDLHFECKAFLHFDWELKCVAESLGQPDVAQRPFHGTRASGSILAYKVIQAIMGFANAGGGLILLGVAEQNRSERLPAYPNGIPAESATGDFDFLATGIEPDGIGMGEGLIPFTGPDGPPLTIAALVVEPQVRLIDVVESKNDGPEVFEIYPWLAFNNNGPLTGSQIREYIYCRMRKETGAEIVAMCEARPEAAATDGRVARAPLSTEEPVPATLREQLPQYLPPVIEELDFTAEIHSCIVRGANCFVVGDSGMGKSRLPACTKHLPNDRIRAGKSWPEILRYAPPHFSRLPFGIRYPPSNAASRDRAGRCGFHRVDAQGHGSFDKRRCGKIWHPGW